MGKGERKEGRGEKEIFLMSLKFVAIVIIRSMSQYPKKKKKRAGGQFDNED
jgi:hypothetical protein